jgi:hypothetical protein
MTLSQAKYAEAALLARQAIAGNPDPATGARLRRILCVSGLGMGKRGAALRDCDEESVAGATTDRNVRLAGLLVRLQLQVAMRDDQAAIRTLREAEPDLSSHMESRWRFLALAAQVDPQYSAPARQALNELEQAWGSAAFGGYVTRADVESLRRPLLKTVSANSNTR